MTRQELNQLRTGYLKSSRDFEDYGIKDGKPYEVKYHAGIACIFADGEIRTDNNEITNDMLPFLSWGEKK